MTRSEARHHGDGPTRFPSELGPRTPDAGTLERLVYLRIMLREAQQRAQDRTHTGRHLAAIQLDGACEHAMMLAVGELQQTPAWKFHQNFELLRKSLGDKWQPDGWSGVNRLHGTRTEAQHRGTVPDAAEFSRWSADAERFINSLIAAVFSVDLQTVTTAQAVETASVRTHLMRAEAELREDDFNGSYRSSAEALAEARRLWDAERLDALGTAPSRPPLGQDLAPADLRQVTGRMEDLAAIQPFAPDLGEYVWLRSLKPVNWEHVPIARDEAERALSFVVGWVLRWEAFSHRYTKDRRGRWLQAQRPETTTDRSLEPSIQLLDVRPEERRNRKASFLFRFKLTDVPEDGWAAWLHEYDRQLSEHLRAAGVATVGGVSSFCDRTGIIHVRGVTNQEVSEIVIRAVQHAMSATKSRWQAQLNAVAGSRVELDTVAASFNDAIANIAFEGEPLVVETTASAREVGRGADRRIASTVMMRLRLRGDPSLRHELWKALSKTGELGPSHGAPLLLRDDELHAPADVPVERVREALAAAAREVEALREKERQRRAEDAALAETMAQAARDRLEHQREKN